MKKFPGQILFSIIIIGLTSLLFSACAPNQPTVDVNAQRTGFAQTAYVLATGTALAQPTPTETPQPTPTLDATGETTPNAGITNDEANTETEATIAGEDAAIWLSNDPPDNTVFNPGEPFTVTWKLENTGTSTWTTRYYIMYLSGEQMDAPEKVYLPYPVPPGKNVEISVDFIAPEEEGDKETQWQIVNSSDLAFYQFYLIIKVGESEE
jgi:hypothetical protein